MKKALALLLSVLLIAALAACSNGDAVPEQPVEDTTTTTSATAEAPTADMSDTTGATDGGETADPQTETSADDVTALTKDTTASVTADTTAEKTTSATGNPHSTTTTEQTATGKTDPTTGTIGKPTKNTTTGKPPVPTSTTVKPNNPEVTDPTKPTKTTLSNGNGDHFDGDIIVVETPITHNDGLFSYAMSAKIPVQCRTTDDNISVLLSYGLLEGCDPADYITNVVLYVLDDEGNKTILRRIDKKEIMTDYRVDWPVDENGQLIGFVYSHTETISLPVSLCSKTTGRIWLVVAEGTSNGKFGVEVSGMSASICFDYVRSDTNIVFIGRDL